MKLFRYFGIGSYLSPLSFSPSPSPQAAKTLRKSGAGEDGEEDDDGGSSDSTEPPQTLLEIDYDTVIDDEDVIDEFGLFRSLLEGKVTFDTIKLKE